MLEFKCPNCGADLALGHAEVNPTLPTPPFTYWRGVPRGFNAQVQNLTDVPHDVCQVIDKAGAWWRRGADGAWSEVRAPRDMLVAGEPPFSWFVGTGEKRMATTSYDIPDDVTEMLDARGRLWRRVAGENWRPS